jgi:hypothetical protein
LQFALYAEVGTKRRKRYMASSAASTPTTKPGNSTDFLADDALGMPKHIKLVIFTALQPQT